MFARVVAILALFAGASAFAPFAARPMRAGALNANLQQTLETAPGPAIYWGSEGVLHGKEENEIKGTTDFKKFAAAARNAGVDLTSGEYTVLAPTDEAMDNAGKTMMSRDEVLLHVIQGRKQLSDLKMDTPTMQGKVLSYQRFARQDYLDNAIIGQTPQGPATGETHPTHMADNGIIHSIAFVLTLDYGRLSSEQGISTI